MHKRSPSFQKVCAAARAPFLVELLSCCVVVVFSVPLEANLLLKAIRRANATYEFIWIGSDGWGPNLHLYENLDAALGGFFIRFFKIFLVGKVLVGIFVFFKFSESFVQFA